MLTTEYDERFSAQLERREDWASAAVAEACSQEHGASETELYDQELYDQERHDQERSSQELCRYDDEEIVTKPWPPLRW